MSARKGHRQGSSRSSKNKGNSKKKTKNQRRGSCDDDLFDAAWLNEGLNEARSLKRLRKIEMSVAEDFLIDQLRGQLDSEIRQQALFTLLGPGFVQKHFPHHRNDSTYLYNLPDAKRDSVIAEMKLFLCQKVREGLEEYRKNNSIDKRLHTDLREIFSSDLNEELLKDLKRLGLIKIKLDRKNRPKVKELGDTTEARVKFIEKTLTDLIANGPNMDELIMQELTERVLILPQVFRHRLFDKLYLGDPGESALESQWRSYGERVRKTLKQNGLTSIGDWKGKKAVDTSVIVAYERSSALKEEFEESDDNGLWGSDGLINDGNGPDERLVFLTRILAIAKLCDGDASPTHLYWLAKSTRYFPERHGAHSKDEKATALAFHFRSFSDAAIPTRADIFSIAQEAYDELEQEDTKLVLKLQEALTNFEGKNGLSKRTMTMVDPTVFSRSVLCENESAGDNLLRSFIKAKRISDTDAAAVFADLRLFFRKWISEGFVGSLTTNGASLVWDYLFIHQFSRKAFVGVCLGLFNLLKPMLEAVGTYSEAAATLTQGPQVLLIRDWRRVLKHLGKGGSYRDIPEAPNVPDIMMTPPSARPSDERRAMDRRIEAISEDFLTIDEP